MGDFGAALKLMKDGHSVQRQPWQAKGISLRLHYPGDEDSMTLPVILLTRSSGAVAPWLACHNDLIADDWQVTGRRP